MPLPWEAYLRVFEASLKEDTARPLSFKLKARRNSRPITVLYTVLNYSYFHETLRLVGAVPKMSAVLTTSSTKPRYLRWVMGSLSGALRCREILDQYLRHWKPLSRAHALTRALAQPLPHTRGASASTVTTWLIYHTHLLLFLLRSTSVQIVSYNLKGSRLNQDLQPKSQYFCTQKSVISKWKLYL